MRSFRAHHYERRDVSVICEDEVTQHEHADECDITKLIERYNRTGYIPQHLDRVPRYADFSKIVDYHEAMSLMTEAQESFMLLPAKIREEFDHDPSKFLRALDDPSQVDRLIKVGVLTKKETPESEKKSSGEAGG